MMKKSLIYCTFLTFASPALAAINCSTLPTCDSLGYGDEVAKCPNRYLACPFDNTKGLCILEARPGDVTYSLNTTGGKGWLLCDGSYVYKNHYPELYAVIGDNFDTASSEDKFKLPNYQGYFLRVKGTSEALNNNMYKAQMDGLPNITGYWFAEGMMRDIATPVNYGALYTYSTSSRTKWASGAHDYSLSKGIGFDASKSSSVYGRYGYTNSAGSYVTGNTSYVTPRNYALNAFIYSGKFGIAGDPGVCSAGNFLYDDGTCSAAIDSKKTMLGYIIFTSGTSMLVISGGNKTAASFDEASKICQDEGYTQAFPGLIMNTYVSMMSAMPSGSSVVSPIQTHRFYVYYGTSTSSAISCSTTSCTTVTTTSAKYYYCMKTL